MDVSCYHTHTHTHIHPYTHTRVCIYLHLPVSVYVFSSLLQFYLFIFFLCFFSSLTSHSKKNNEKIRSKIRNIIPFLDMCQAYKIYVRIISKGTIAVAVALFQNSWRIRSLISYHFISNIWREKTMHFRFKSLFYCLKVRNASKTSKWKNNARGWKSLLEIFRFLIYSFRKSETFRHLPYTLRAPTIWKKRQRCVKHAREQKFLTSMLCEISL